MNEKLTCIAHKFGDKCIACNEEFLALNKHISIDLRVGIRAVDSLPHRERQRQKCRALWDWVIAMEGLMKVCMFFLCIYKGIKLKNAQEKCTPQQSPEHQWYQTWNPKCCPCEEPTYSNNWRSKPLPGRGLDGTACGLGPPLQEDCVWADLGPLTDSISYSRKVTMPLTSTSAPSWEAELINQPEVDKMQS